MTTGQRNEMKQNGFSLLELMITISIAAILLAIAVPSFQSLMANNRITSQTNNFLASLALARSEALKQGTGVSVCASANGSSCAGTSTTDWSTGWIVFTDSGTIGSVDGSDTVLRVAEALRGGVVLTSISSSTQGYIRYSPNGSVTATNSFTLCKSGMTGRTIAISMTGRASPTSYTCP